MSDVSPHTERRVPETWITSGDCVKWLRELLPDSVDAIVCDPPYGLGFMGKGWDKLPPGPEFAEQALRVLKPGAHILAFGGTRTYHRLVVALEDAGFEIRDTLAWCYFNGFPKSLDVSKAIDKAACAEREVVGRFVDHKRSWDITAPTTPEAKRWAGWGTALKPAIEPIVLARKPLIGTVAANVLAHGTGALNIDGCRFATGDPMWLGPRHEVKERAHRPLRPWRDPMASEGRWPANLVHCPKASRKERERGCGDLPSITGPEAVGRTPGSAGVKSPRAGAGASVASVRNHHPTVKPVRLMRWLVRLVTPPGGVVVDPFMGSGTTGVAAVLEGIDFAGVERDEQYLMIARARIEHATRHPEEWESG